MTHEYSQICASSGEKASEGNRSVSELWSARLFRHEAGGGEQVEGGGALDAMGILFPFVPVWFFLF